MATRWDVLIETDDYAEHGYISFDTPELASGFAERIGDSGVWFHTPDHDDDTYYPAARILRVRVIRVEEVQKPQPGPKSAKVVSIMRRNIQWR